MNETTKQKIETIVRDSIENLKEDGITSYDEKKTEELVQYHIERYEEVSDDEIDNLFHVVDDVIATQENMIKGEKADLFNSKKRYFEEFLKIDIIKREIMKKLTEQEIDHIRIIASEKKIKGKKLTKMEEHFQYHDKHVYDCAFTDEELEKIREVAIKKKYPDASDEEIKELKKEIEELSITDLNTYLFRRVTGTLDDPIIVNGELI